MFLKKGPWRILLNLLSHAEEPLQEHHCRPPEAACAVYDVEEYMQDPTVILSGSYILNGIWDMDNCFSTWHNLIFLF